MKNHTHRILLYVKALHYEITRHILIKHAVGALLAFSITMVWNFASRSFVFLIPAGQFIGALQSAYAFFLLIYISLFISKSFESFHHIRTSVGMFALPATPFEKYCSIFLFHFLINVVFLAIFMPIIMSLLFVVTQLITGNANMSWIGRGPYGQWFRSIFWPSYVKFLSNATTIFGYFFMGAVLFKKNHFFKTTLFLGFSYVIVLTILVFVKTVQIKLHNYDEADVTWFIQFYSSNISNVVFVVGSVLAVIFGYFRFSKLQVV